MARAYELVLPFGVYGALLAMPRLQRREVERFLHRLANHPRLEGDFEAPADDGRIHQATTVGRWLMSWWVDHAVCEVRVTTLEVIE